MSSKSEEPEQIKIVLIGESGIGKTCLYNRIIDDTYKGCNPSTVGSDFRCKVKTFPKYQKELQLEIWDTAGAEAYRSLSKIFYQKADIAIACYDITDRKSFDEIKNYWIGNLRTNAKNDIIIGLTANKSDLFEEQVVPDNEGMRFARENGFLFFQTSAKEGTGIVDLIDTLGNEYLKRSGCVERTSFTLQKAKTFPKKKKEKCC